MLHVAVGVGLNKEKRLTPGELEPNIPQEKAENRVYLRQALTKYPKTLLYIAKTQLGKSFQFVWRKERWKSVLV